MENVSVTENFAFSKNGGGARFFGRSILLSRSLFRDNTAARDGGGTIFESGTNATIRDCSFIGNTAGSNGGALVGAGSLSTISVSTTKLLRNTAFKEGGCVYMYGTALVSLSSTILSGCVALSNGGGVSSRGDSTLILTSKTSIQRSESLQDMGGGVLAAGGSLTINGAVVLAKNRARRGGGICYMSRVAFHGATTTLVHENIVSENGGGLYGFSSFARLDVDANHMLSIEVSLCVCVGW